METIAQMTFRQLITQYRESSGWTQERLSTAVGCTPKAIANVENGRTHTLQKMFWPKVAEVLGITEADVAAAARDSRPTLADIQAAARRNLARQSPPDASGTHGGGKAADVGTTTAVMPGPQTPPKPRQGKAYASPASDYRLPDEFRAVIEEARRQGLSAGEILEMMKKRK